MKKQLLPVLTIIAMWFVLPLYAQTPTKAQAEEMARKMMTMTPARMMKFRDSLMKAIMQQQAKALPNGDQLLIQHHYDTTYTTVSFYYSKKVAEAHSNGGGPSGSSFYICAGKSSKAPMMYEANGRTIVQCSMNPVGANTDEIDEMANGINKNKKYLKTAQAIKNTDIARQMSFSSMSVNDNSLSGTASENSGYTGKGGTTITTTNPSVTRMSFSFIYDPVQVLSTVGLGASIKIHTSSHDEKGNHAENDDTENIGMRASTDPHFAKIAGAPTQTSGTLDNAYLKVTKTTYGFKIQYSKTEYIRENNANITENLTADIGGPEQQYEAVLEPMPASKYETWLPKGPKVDGSDDAKGDDSSKFYVTVHDKNNPDKLYPGNFTVRYELKDITHYKGFNSNYPVYAGNETADLKICDSTKYFSAGTFDPGRCTDSVATSVINNGSLAIVQITSMDYGAWGKLTAKVTLDDGTELTASPYYDKGETFITIPFDRDENKIADAWEKSENILHKGYGLDWDEDVKPDNHHNGDNISLIDEYRGFLTEDDSYNPVYKRFSPQVKELITLGLANMNAADQQYKSAIKMGALGYSRASGVKVYHLSNSRYGQREPGEPSGVTYGRWVNYNTPLHTYTRGIVIITNSVVRPAGDKTVASTVPVNGASAADTRSGGIYPEDTQNVVIWTDNVVKTSYKPDEYLPANGNTNDPNVIRKNGYLRAANTEFNVNIDPMHASDLVSQYYTQNLSRIITFTVAHELCHTTHVHHHHLAAGDDGAYDGVAGCPVRYWLNNYNPVNCSTWVAMYITGKWNPATLTTPWGINQPMQLCTSGDNCFSQLQLKKH
ncbi:DUF2059 domain-containing protein [Mucilaginibacter xinganensis]|uniref:Uncharacterized protein n=1 Tax=Mucilaginibacter xinganensis TaxID=1234841 RepID=A0A223P2X1_9SPHI|nr:hypothetical protein [Mucilaginibacter xinganensis]ASU36390.1 hypothetical protein MuYL_4505 [Mucilaginibacter xinganensis]